MGLNRPKHFNIIRSQSPDIIQRKRLFNKLEQAKQRVYWIMSPPGSGKTAFIESYLTYSACPSICYKLGVADHDLANFFEWFADAIDYTLQEDSLNWPKFAPEYSMGLQGFSRTFFNQLYAALPDKFVLVFDDYHVLTEANGFNQVLLVAINSLPEHGRIAVISREAYPDEFACLYETEALLLVDWDDLRFTQSEGEFFLKKKGVQGDAEINLIQSLAQGWVSGMILMASSKDKLAQHRVGSIEMMKNEDYQLLFDYFASEIFHCYEEAVQAFLMRVSVAKDITPLCAASLTDIGQYEAERILEGLVDKNYFTNAGLHREKFYEFHPLFRQFLSAQLEKNLSREELLKFKVKAGDILYQCGYIADAAEQWIDAAAWSQLCQLCVEQAQSFLDAGRNQTILVWLNKIPSRYLEQQSWLRYWQARCLSPYNQQQAVEILAAVYEDFKQAENIEGQYLALAAVTNIYMYDSIEYASSDLWMTAVVELKQRHPKIPNAEIGLDLAAGLLACVLWRKGNVREFPWLLGLSEELLHKTSDADRLITLGFGLLWFYLYQGNRNKSKEIVELINAKVKPDRLQAVNAIKWYGILANYHYYNGGDEAQILQYAHKAKEVAQTSGINYVNAMIFLMDIYTGLLVGDKSRVEKGINALWEYVWPGKRQEVFYYYVSGWNALTACEYELAEPHLDKSLKLSEKLGMQQTVMHSFICFLRGLTKIQLNRDSELDECVSMLGKLAQDTGSNLSKWKLLILIAYRSYKNNERSKLLDLKNALIFGEQNDLIRVHAHISSVLSELYATALENDVVGDYVNRLILAQRIVPNLKAKLLLQWPWQIKIFTLGRFKVECDGETLVFSGKQQRRPLELLKLLISSQGQILKSQQVVEKLWPHTDAESGEKNFKTTLARLRKLIGKDAIRLSDGKLFVNQELVWVDAWVVSELIEKIKIRSLRFEYAAEEFKHLTLLYAGDFLKGDAFALWLSSYAENLKGKYLEVIGLYAEYLLQIGNREGAITLANQALDNDNLYENFYRIIMRAYIGLGEYAAAIDTYQRCQEVFSERLAIDPSAETKRIIAEIKEPD